MKTSTRCSILSTSLLVSIFNVIYNIINGKSFLYYDHNIDTNLYTFKVLITLISCIVLFIVSKLIYNKIFKE